jgi:proteic killer suppression protein
MILSFRNRGTADLFNGVSSKAAWAVGPTNLVRVAQRNLDMVNAADALDDLKVPPKNRLEKLTKDRAGQHAIRINDQYRVCFVWTDAGAEQVEVTDYH